jgi:hypothetical protein
VSSPFSVLPITLGFLLRRFRFQKAKTLARFKGEGFIVPNKDVAVLMTVVRVITIMIMISSIMVMISGGLMMERVAMTRMVRIFMIIVPLIRIIVISGPFVIRASG